ncbi:MAG: hypothetical protein ACLUNQ_09155 [Oscillospiraceae bacterium]
MQKPPPAAVRRRSTFPWTTPPPRQRTGLLQPGKKSFFAGRQTPTPDEVLSPPQPEPAPEPEQPPQPTAPEPVTPPQPAAPTPKAEPVDLEKAAREVSRQIEQELSEPEEQYQYPPITLLEQERPPATLPPPGRRCAAIPSAWRTPCAALAWMLSPARWSGVPASPAMSLLSPKG